MIAAAVLYLVYSSPVAAQVSPSTPKAATVHITESPSIERADSDFAIIRWTSNNPGGSPVHYGVVRYGVGPNDLSRTSKSPIRVNPSHPSAVFRVRVEGLKRGTKYYYTVSSEESNGTSDNVKSPVKQFTTAGPAGPGSTATETPKDKGRVR
jgi:hypothetical protein